jgi:uncharacterized protein YecE (DUF72 family)
MRAWLGTCGYSYPDWVGTVYPRGTKPARMLALYSRLFPAVELNFTFYRTPTADLLARQADQTPPGFQFLVKAPRTLSHDRAPADLQPFRAAADELRQRGRLLGVLCQFPPSFRNGPKALSWLAALGRGLEGLTPAVEFRHRSWDRPEVPAWLAGHGLDLVSVDVPDLPTLFPRGLVQSGPRLYVRFHSRDAARWYGSHERRYDYRYSEEELAEWARALGQAAGRAERAVLLFNNCFTGQAVDNARQMAALLRRGAPGVEVVEAPAGEGQAVRQGSLFDTSP